VPIEITCNTYLDGEENMGKIANVGPPNDSQSFIENQHYILMDNEEESKEFLAQDNLRS
jgi:hypothetical protein